MQKKHPCSSSGGLSGWSQLYHSCTARRWFIEISKAPRRPKVFGQDRPTHRGFLLFYVAKKPVFFGQLWAYPIYNWERPMVEVFFDSWDDILQVTIIPANINRQKIAIQPPKNGHIRK